MNRSAASEAGARLAELEEARRKIKAILPEPGDDDETIETKSCIISQAIDSTIDMAKEALATYARMTRTGVYDGPAAPLEGQSRAKILIGDQIVRLPATACVNIERLRAGQFVEISAGDTAVIVGADPSPPTGGEVLHVVNVGTTSTQRWVEVEEAAGERRRRVNVSGFLDAEQLDVGDSVRVVGTYAYELLKNTATKRAEFLEEVRYHPDGHVHFADVKGQDDAVLEMELILERMVAPEAYPGAELLGSMMKAVFGPPGNGKTMLFAATANALVERVGREKARVYYVRGGALKNKYVGNSEANTRAIFDQAARDYRDHGIRSLICFEEAETVMVQRDVFDNTGVSQGITATLLTYLGGAVPLDGVLVICLSNHEASFDAALLRPERLGGSNRIQMARLRPPALREIVRGKLSNGCATLTGGTPLEAFLEALDAALDVSYGTAIVGNQRVDVLGRHLTSGAAAAGAIKAGIARLHLHRLLTSKKRCDTPFRFLTPALLFYGAKQTLNSVMESHACEGGMHRARTLFAGDLVRADEARTLTELRASPAASLATPDIYDLSMMVDLETGGP